MSIKGTCACGKKLSAKDELAGRPLKCPACGRPVSIPATQDTAEAFIAPWDQGHDAPSEAGVDIDWLAQSAPSANQHELHPFHAPKYVSFQETDSGWTIIASLKSFGSATTSGFILCLTSVIAVFILDLSFRMDGRDSGMFGIGWLMLLLSSVVGWYFAMCLWGKIAISRHGSDLIIFQGLGSMGTTQRFDAAQTTAINETVVYRKNGVPFIELTGATTLRFGLLLNAEQRRYLLLVLRRLLLNDQDR